ncbi:3-oxoadipate enol-lactone hydrolase [Aaosphaeria arxii CBS 175.79]|uniref:3-oxoadipate enol-lactone hydrolase n=1 Tax=Aaosphaeria arxii CBS 175.79 TaxID=1450172 RepID=A0A6A5XHQ9_9PLEO|nr:3-oxoadipate enol-lactone hydrolase [Aaosphaeria arxii CBS 175.79]KAF2012351.1 3-oxoadipate enol-lactone hydrolase [Aaosphaeria arxii CBS 175.79]
MPFLQLESKRIHYTDLKPSSGNAPRETFIFHHGLGSSQNYYHAVALELQSHDFRCILFDTTGAGRSPYTYVEQSIETLSGDVIGILDALEVDKAVVVGHSMGGIVAANLAAERSDRVVATILIGPVYPSPAAGPVFAQRIQTVESSGMEAMANAIPSAATGAKASPVARAMIRELLLAQDPAGYISNCRIIVNAKRPNYEGIKVPVLILAGGEDKSAPLEGCRRMFGEMGATEEKRLEVLEGIGHWHCLEDWEDVARRILAFYHDIQ